MPRQPWSHRPPDLHPSVRPLAPMPPFCRTLEFLMRHLVHMASFSAQTNMHARNLAIVWAPNLLRWARQEQRVGSRLSPQRWLQEWVWLRRCTGEGCGGLVGPREKQEGSEVHRVGWGSPTGHKAFVSSYTVSLSSGIGTGRVLVECLLSKHLTVSWRTGLQISVCRANSEKS